MFRCIALCLIALNCACLALSSQKLQKCCNELEVFDYERQRCGNIYNINLTENWSYQVTDFPFKCPAGIQTADVSLANLSDIIITVPQSNRTLHYTEFCVAYESREAATIAFCEPPTIDKCCPIGQTIHPSLRKCVPDQQAPTIEKLKRYDGQPLKVSHNPSRNDYHLKYCTNRMTRYRDTIELDDFNEAVMTESLFNATNDVGYYCVDALGDPKNGNYSVHLIS